MVKIMKNWCGLKVFELVLKTVEKRCVFDRWEGWRAHKESPELRMVKNCGVLIGSEAS